MNAEQYRRISEAFDELVTLSAQERSQEISGRFPDEPELRAEVEALLAEHDRIDAPVGTAVGLEAAGKSLGGSGRSPGVRVVLPEELLPVLKGAYRLLRVIGEGGMGVVYEAEQSFPRRRVALKSIRAGFATASMLRRFKTEIQLLARLDHPGIAQVYEAGYADDRSPDQAFLSMELVDGQPLNRYARARELSVRERMELMLRVCDAVQHAHQRGVIHRDLKPANILVNESGQPKVLDFGIARAVDEIDEGTVFTRAGQVVGTPSYMSPEQLRGEAVDTRADVYALGVIMYELLSDELPFDVSKVPLSDALRVVLERATPLSKIKTTLRGDVETVVSKAMHAERDRRYASVGAFADDIRCVLESRPINARRDSAVYVLGKFAGRHKAMVSVLGVLAVALVAFGVLSVTMAAVNARLARESDAARLEAENESRKNAALSRVLEEELSAARIDRGRAEAAVGKLKHAEDSLWSEYFSHEGSTQARWGLWELYHRIPCLWTNYGPEPPSSAAVGTSGRFIVLGYPSGRVDIHKGADGERVYSIETLGAGAMSLAVSSADELAIGLANGRLALVTLTEDGKGVVPRRLDSTPTHAGGVRVLSYSGDGRRLAAGGSDRRVSVWDSGSGAMVDAWVAGSDPVLSVSMNADGSEFVSVAGRKEEDRSWWRLGSPRQRASITIPGGFLVFGMSMLADGKTVAIGYALSGPETRGYLLGLFDLNTMTMASQVEGLSANVTGLSESADGSGLALSAGQSLLVAHRGPVTQAGRGLVVRSLGQQRGTLISTMYLRDGRIITVSDRAEIRCFSTVQEPAVTALGGLSTWCFTAAWSPDGKRISMDGGEFMAAYETGSWRKVSTTPFERRLRQRSMQYLSDSRSVMMGGVDGRIRVADSDTGTITETYGVPRPEIYAMAVSKDERTMVTGHADGVIRVWDRGKGEVVRELPKLERRVESLSLSSDGTRLASSGGNAGIVLWETAQWTRGPTLATSYVPWGVAFSPGGKDVAATTHAGTLEVFDVESGARRALIKAHQRLAPGLAYSPDGKLIATGSEDGSVRLWDASSMRQLLTFDGNSAEIVTVAFDPTSRYLAASSAGLRALVYDLRWSDAAIEGNKVYQEALYRLYGDGAKK